MKKLIIMLLLLPMFQSIVAQELKVYKTKSYGKRPRLIWYRTGNDSIHKNFTVWRADLKSKKFDSIHTAHFVMVKKNSVRYVVIDTTLTKKAIYRYYIQVRDKNNKILTSPIALGHNLGRIPKPRVVRISAEQDKDKKAITLHWKLNYNFSVRSISLFRSSYGDKNYVKIAELGGDATAYTDIVPLSNHNYYYFLLIADYFGYETPSPYYPAFTLFKQKAIPPQNLSYTKNENSVELHWTNTEKTLSGYQVFRSIDDNDFVALHKMQNTNKQEVKFVDKIDNNLKGRQLRYYIVNYSDSYVRSETSDTLSVFFVKIQNPLPPKELNVIKQDDNRLKLIWTLPKDKNIAGFNVYLEKPKFRKLNDKLVPSTKNYFLTDKVFGKGNYTFSVETIGANKLKSELKTMASINILSAYAKLIVDMKQTKNGIVLSWKKYPDTRLDKILLYRQSGNNNPKLLKSFSNSDEIYTDKNIKNKTLYYYTFYGKLTTGETLPLNEGFSVRR